MKITNSQIFSLVTALSTLKLEDQSSRSRRRFLRLFSPYIQDLNEARKELQEKYANKNVKGNPVITNNKFSFTPENNKKLQKEITALGDEVIDVDMGKQSFKDTQEMKSVLKNRINELNKDKSDKYTAAEFDYIENIEEILKVLK